MTKAVLSPLRLRLLLGNGRALGPGKADLLDAIAAHGSISAAGRALGMSYKRAWQLVDDLNNSFIAPLVRATKGGGHGGGAILTDTGVAVLAAYRAIERTAQRSAATHLRQLQKLAAKPRVE